MQKCLLLYFSCFVWLLSKAQIVTSRDSALRIIDARINVTTNEFTATTVVELELFNPNSKILDGEVNFSLVDGQVVNDFKLDINGRYRDGVIIEKSQARVAYENVIRRKVDPGLLEMTATNQYRIRVYPVPAKGSRRLAFTVQQLLVMHQQQLDYLFPLNFNSTIDHLYTKIAVKSTNEPFTNSILLQGQKFLSADNGYSLQAGFHNIASNNSLHFSIPLKQKTPLCVFDRDCDKAFMARIIPDSLPLTKRFINTVTVFWDVSLSAEKRQLSKEIAFLETYLKTCEPQQLTIVAFAVDVVETKTLVSPSKNVSALRKFLEGQSLDGGTRFSNLHSRDFPADEYLLFSDGYISFGEGGIDVNEKPLFCIQSTAAANTPLLDKMAKITSGKRIDLFAQTVEQAIASLQQPEWNLLLSKEEKDAGQLVWMKTGNSFLVSGVSTPGIDSLQLTFVYADQKQTIKLPLHDAACKATEPANAASFLQQQSAKENTNSKDSLHALAMEQNVVSESTSLIVLDALEDYYQYQIMPPKELQEEFKKRYPALPNKREEKEKEKEILVYQKLQQALTEYNEKLRWWSPTLTVLTLPPFEAKAKAKALVVSNDKTETTQTANSPLAFKSSALSEVVVTGYGTQRRRDLAGAVSSINANQLGYSSTVQSALTGRVAGLNVNAIPGSSSTVQLRGFASIRGGSEPLYVVDGIPIDAAAAMSMSTFDIESISVLKDAAATAL